MTAQAQVRVRATGESACRPGLDPGPVWPVAMRRKPTATCDYVLSGSRCLAVDDETMCPECARSDYQLGNERRTGSVRPLRWQVVARCVLERAREASLLTERSGRSLFRHAGFGRLSG